MIVLDAGVLIAYLDNTDAHHDPALGLLTCEINDDFAASSLRLAEVFLGPTRTGRVPEAVAALRDLEVTAQPLPSDAAIELAELRVNTGLRMPDCCVLLIARQVEARVATFDAVLDKAAAKIGLVVASP